MATCHPINNICHPYQLQPPTDAAVAATSMTLQQKIFRLMPIEFEKPLIQQLPEYIDVRDPRWAADPRVRPCIQPTAVPVNEHRSAHGIGVAFYSSGGADAESDTESDKGCVVQQPCVSIVGSETCSDVSSDAASIQSVHAVDVSSVKSSHCSENCENGSITCETSPNLLHKPDNLPVGVAKTEPVGTSNAVSAPAARHTFQHNVSWLTVARSTGVQKLSHAKNRSN